MKLQEYFFDFHDWYNWNNNNKICNTKNATVNNKLAMH